MNLKRSNRKSTRVARYCPAITDDYPFLQRNAEGNLKSVLPEPNVLTTGKVKGD